MNWTSEAGDSIVAPIRIDVSGNIGFYNNLNTIFDLYNKEYERDLLRDQNVLYTKNGEPIDQLLTQRRQVPKRKQNEGSPEKSIAQATSKSQEEEFSIDVDSAAEELAELRGQNAG